MVNCPNCTAEQPDASKFCSECGVALGLEIAATVTQHGGVSPASRRGESSSPDSSHHGRFLPGTKVADRYRIVSLLGKGGMGEVYRADDLKLGHTVALKFLPKDLADDPKRLEYFHTEVRLTRQISHPNVCRVYDIGEVEGQHFLSMEYIDGEDLRLLLRRIGRLPGDKGAEISRQLCAGLASAHERGVLHRDLKPANIMIDGRGQVRITDFGLARLTGDAAEGEVVGTPAYMAPEQLALGKTTIQSDLYSLGLVLYEMFTGEPVHTSNSAQELLRKHQESSLSQPSALQGDIDPMVERIILRCLEKEAFQRPKSAHEVAASLPGGDPLAAAIAAGETPSPEMVAAAGDTGGLSYRAAITCLAVVLVGLLLNFFLADETPQLREASLDFVPAVLADEARDILVNDFGYDQATANTVYGIAPTTNQGLLRFWFRQRPAAAEFEVGDFWSDWGKVSRVRPTFLIPRWDEPGECGMLLIGNKRLSFFRAVAPIEIHTDAAGPPPRWSQWFTPERTGLFLPSTPDEQPPADLSDEIQVLEFVEDRWRTPPDTFDQVAVWKGVNPENEETFFVEAAAFRDRPTYFQRFTTEEFEATTGQAVASSLELGRELLLSLYGLLLVAGILLAWRNLRSGRADRRGAQRLTAYVFFVDAVVWITFARHTMDVETEVGNVLSMGVSQVLFNSARIWIWYMALEPFARRVWPHILISSSRLLNGRFRDPTIGRDLLLGAACGVLHALVFRLNVVAQLALRVDDPPAVAADSMTLAGFKELIGAACRAHADAIFVTFFTLMLLIIFRMMLVTERRASLSFLVILGVTVTLLREGNPWLTSIAAFIGVGLMLALLVRYGVLAVAALFTTSFLLSESPLTLEATHWYFGHGLFAAMLTLTAAIYGFYTSLSARPGVAATVGQTQ